MKRLVLAIMALAAFNTFALAENKIVTVGIGYSSTSVNATIFRHNSIVSHNGWQFVAYYDDKAYVTIGKRKIGRNSFTITRTQYKGKVTDAHNVISMGIDGDGYLHLAFDHHNNRLHYCRSTRPYATTLTEEMAMVGNDEDKVTYPEFYTLRNGDILFAYRSGKSGQGNLVMNRYNTNSRKWSRVHDILIDGEGKRNAYWQLCVDANGVIHMAWVWRETWLVETNHDLCYAASDDGGVTWHTSTGQQYQLPITLSNAEYIAHIPQNSELINQTSIAADNLSRPYIASYWKAAGDSAPQYKIIYQHANTWAVSNVGRRSNDFTLSGGGTKMIPMSRPQIAVRSKSKKVSIYYIYRDAETGSKVTIAETDDLLATTPPHQHNESTTSAAPHWTITQPFSLDVDAWEPSYDTELWNSTHRLHIFVQKVSQGDGEKTIATPPQEIYILQLND